MSNARPTNWRPGKFRTDPARTAAFRVLIAVEKYEAYANIELSHELRANRLSKRDAAYATNLCYGTLRMQGRWDAIIEHCTADRSITSLDPDVKILLRMGTHQLLDFSTPAHAAINETVNLARSVAGSGASGFINAVLHRVSERSISQWRQILIDDAGGSVNSVAFLSRWYSHPAWIVRAISESLKANNRVHKDILSVLQADNEPADVALAAREISVPELCADIERGHMRSRAGSLVESAVILENGDPGRVFAVKDALAGVQDEGSQLIARMFARTPISGKDELWLDMCAGPGGKTASIASYAAQCGARVRANELHEHRLNLVAQAIRPWDDIVDLRCGDGRELGALEPGEYDRVLVDAPCTGIGALRRRPEARWHKEAADAIELAVLQNELLDSAWDAVREGGIVVYSTCSPYVRETRAVTEAFLKRHADAQLLDTPALASDQARVKLTGDGGHLQLWPDQHHSDAMYMVMIRKNPNSQEYEEGKA